LEAVKALVAGFVDAITVGDVPIGLAKIALVERSAGRARRLRDVVESLVPHGVVPSDRAALDEVLEPQSRVRLADAGIRSAQKKLVFVAMKFDDDSEDRFRFGIGLALDQDRFLCERGDSDLQAGDILDGVLGKIRNADYVIADVTTDNPNVMLELGYAWGTGRPVVIIAQEGRRQDLPFNIRNHRTIFFRNDGHLHDQLRKVIALLEQEPT